MTATCPWCGASVPAGAAFCSNCGRQAGASGNAGQPQPQWQPNQLWQAPQRTGPSCAAWVVGCAALLMVCFIAFVIIIVAVTSSTGPERQRQRHTTTKRVSYGAPEREQTSRVATTVSFGRKLEHA